MTTTETLTSPERVGVKIAKGARPQLAMFDMAKFTKEPDRIQKCILTRTKNFEEKKDRIRTRFNELHAMEKKRFFETYGIEKNDFSDLIGVLAKEFCVEKTTITRALKS